MGRLSIREESLSKLGPSERAFCQRVALYTVWALIVVVDEEKKRPVWGRLAADFVAGVRGRRRHKV